MGEILASRWHTAMLTDVRSRISPDYIRPDPQNPDSDADGVKDGDDPYPTYPFKTEIPLSTIKVDGNLSDWTQNQQNFWIKQIPYSDIKVDIHACHDDKWLYMVSGLKGNTMVSL